MPAQFFKGPGITEDILCAGKESTFDFLEDVLDEVVELFPGDFIHIGGDFRIIKQDWESIVQKINEGLARNDTLVILLSPNSVSSKWVQRELNSVLMTQLSDQNVTVVPLLIAECDIPTVLKYIKYIDMTRDYQTGFIKLCEFLKLRAGGSAVEEEEE